MNYHTSIRTLPVFNFHEVLRTGDYSFLRIHEEDDVLGSMFDHLGAQQEKADPKEIWDKIYNEYCEAAGVSNRHLKQVAKIEELRFKHDSIEILLMLAVDPFESVQKKAREKLKSFNYIFRNGQDQEREYNRLRNQLKSLLTKIKIEEDKLPKEDKQEAVKLMKQAVSLENIFPGRVIDIYTMPVEKWIALNEMAQEKINAQKQLQHG